VGIPDRFGEVGKMDYLKKTMRMTADDIAGRAIEVVAKKHVLARLRGQ
jgi:transketolase C-terminal domain/subunit